MMTTCIKYKHKFSSFDMILLTLEAPSGFTRLFFVVSEISWTEKENQKADGRICGGLEED